MCVQLSDKRMKLADGSMHEEDLPAVAGLEKTFIVIGEETFGNTVRDIVIKKSCHILAHQGALEGELVHQQQLFGGFVETPTTPRQVGRPTAQGQMGHTPALARAAVRPQRTAQRSPPSARAAARPPRSGQRTSPSSCATVWLPRMAQRALAPACRAVDRPPRTARPPCTPTVATCAASNNMRGDARGSAATQLLSQRHHV